MNVKMASRAAIAVAAIALGSVAVPSPASAAQWNSFSLNTPFAQSGSIRTIWENYIRSHTDQSNIKYTASSGFQRVRMDLRYESNHRIFASKIVGTAMGEVTLASNWGPTRFQVGLNSGVLGGNSTGSLYY